MAKGLYANIQAKRKRIAAGSGEKMRKVGSKGAPTAKNFKQAAAKPKVLTEATRRNLRSSGGLYFSNPEFRLKHKGRK